MRNLFVSICVAISFSVAAQQNDKDIHPLNKFIVKWSPLHLLDFYTTFQIALEQRISKNVSLQYDVGPVLSTVVLNQAKYSGQHGYKAKLQLRFYLKEQTKHWAFYYGPEIYYNHINYSKSETYIVHPYDYYQYITYGMQYREKGIDFKFGTLFRAQRFCLDLQIGIACRIVNYASVDKPSSPEYQQVFSTHDSAISSTLSLAPAEKDSNGVSPTIGVRLGYVITK